MTVARQDPASGALETVAVTQVPSPSFLAWHPDGRHLYAVHEKADGMVTAFATDGTGRLEPLNTRPTGGAGPCHLVVHPAGGHLVTANYGSGSVTVHPLRADGRLGERTDLVQHQGSGPRKGRQDGPHAHQVRVTPDGRYVLAVDLGADAIFVYRLDLATGKLSPAGKAHTEPGAGPRHLVFGPAHTVHVACELDSTVTSFSFANGVLTRRATIYSTVEGSGNYPSEIALSADARFVYLANRGRDLVTVFAVAGAKLRPMVDVPAGGAWPRHLAVVGGYLYVANQHSHQVVCFRLDPDTGLPEPTRSALEVPNPACVLAR